MISITPQERAKLLDSALFQVILNRERALDCFLSACDDPEFQRGWDRVAEEDPVDPLRHLGIGLIVVRLFPFFTDLRVMSRAIALVDAGCSSLRHFREIPKWTPAEHKEYFGQLEVCTAKLRDLIDGPYGHCLDQGYYQVEPIRLALARLHDITQLAKGTESFSRPNAKHADRTHVTKDLVVWARYFGSPTHGSVAAIVNAIFPNYEPIDASFVQAIARRTPSPST